ncbi:MAG: hypothetical protein WC975_11745 [Phycisphaerae bacterium]
MRKTLNVRWIAFILVVILSLCSHSRAAITGISLIDQNYHVNGWMMEPVQTNGSSYAQDNTIYASGSAFSNGWQINSSAGISSFPQNPEYDSFFANSEFRGNQGNASGSGVVRFTAISPTLTVTVQEFVQYSGSSNIWNQVKLTDETTGELLMSPPPGGSAFSFFPDLSHIYLLEFGAACGTGFSPLTTWAQSNVSVTVTPEPTSFLLFGLTILVLRKFGNPVNTIRNSP